MISTLWFLMLEYDHSLFIWCREHNETFSVLSAKFPAEISDSNFWLINRQLLPPREILLFLKLLSTAFFTMVVYSPCFDKLHNACKVFTFETGLKNSCWNHPVVYARWIEIHTFATNAHNLFQMNYAQIRFYCQRKVLLGQLGAYEELSCFPS